MTDLSAFLAYGVLVLLAVFVCEAIYVLFFRNFGLVKFQIAFEVPATDANTVWSTYFDGLNAWNSVMERLSYDVVSEAPRVVRSTARMRGTQDPPSTTEWKCDVFEPEKRCHTTLVKVNGVAIEPEAQTSETFEVASTDTGTTVKVETAIPVRGWVWMPLHRRFLSRIYQDLRVACLEKTGAPFELGR